MCFVVVWASEAFIASEVVELDTKTISAVVFVASCIFIGFCVVIELLVLVEGGLLVEMLPFSELPEDSFVGMMCWAWEADRIRRNRLNQVREITGFIIAEG